MPGSNRYADIGDDAAYQSTWLDIAPWQNSA